MSYFYFSAFYYSVKSGFFNVFHNFVSFWHAKVITSHKMKTWISLIWNVNRLFLFVFMKNPSFNVFIYFFRIEFLDFIAEDEVGSFISLFLFITFPSLFILGVFLTSSITTFAQRLYLFFLSPSLLKIILLLLFGIVIHLWLVIFGFSLPFFEIS